MIKKPTTTDNNPTNVLYPPQNHRGTVKNFRMIGALTRSYSTP